MATTTNLIDYLKGLGYDDSVEYDVPESASDAAMAGVQAFVREHSDEPQPESVGIIHITGPNVEDNSAPVRSVGTLLTAIQDGVDAVGAAIMGKISLSGSLPSTITGRTQLSLVASPLPGSVVIQVAPTLDRMADLYPEEKGEPLFDIEKEIDAEPLADQAFTEFSTLVKELGEDDPLKKEFVDHLTELGPRVASNMRGFCDSVDKGGVDVSFEWSQPGKEPESSFISHSSAKYAVTVIDNANIENQSVNIVGTLLTVTTSIKDRLRVLKQDGSECIVTIGSIEPADLISVHSGDKVSIEAEQVISNRPGSRQKEKLIGVSLRKVDSPPLDGEAATQQA